MSTSHGKHNSKINTSRFERVSRSSAVLENVSPKKRDVHVLIRCPNSYTDATSFLCRSALSKARRHSCRPSFVCPSHGVNDLTWSPPCCEPVKKRTSPHLRVSGIYFFRVAFLPLLNNRGCVSYPILKLANCRASDFGAYIVSRILVDPVLYPCLCPLMMIITRGLPLRRRGHPKRPSEPGKRPPAQILISCGNTHVDQPSEGREAVQCKMATQFHSPDFFCSQILFESFAQAVVRDIVRENVKDVLTRLSFVSVRRCRCRELAHCVYEGEPNCKRGINRKTNRHWPCPRTSREILPLGRSLCPRAHSTCIG